MHIDFSDCYACNWNKQIIVINIYSQNQPKAKFRVCYRE